jgi:hypothetical protein
MSLLTLIVALVVVGLLLWLTTFIPMDAQIRSIMHVVVVIAVILWLLSALGVLNMLGDVPVVPRH